LSIINYQLTHKFSIVNYQLSIIIILLLSSCSTARLSTGIQQYEKGEYFDATQTLKQVYRKSDPRDDREQKGLCSWYLGLCYEKLMVPAQAASSFQNAQRYGVDEISLLLHLAQAQHRQGRYRDAQQSYQQYLDLVVTDPVAEAGLESCQQAATWKESASRYQVKRFAPASGRRADFSPAIWGENNEYLYYTSSSDKSTGDEKSPITGTKYFDIWRLQQDEKGRWQRPELLEGINTSGDEGTPCFSADGNTMYYTACGGDGQLTVPRIYVSNRSEANWSKGQQLKITGDTVCTFAHPAISPDGRWLYFVSNMPGGEGGLDIWRAQLRAATDVAFIENLGPAINTQGDEMFPSFSPDGLLYFSTNGRETFGGLDIYSARLDEWDTWHLLHLGAPINSSGDDFGMTFGRGAAFSHNALAASTSNEAPSTLNSKLSPLNSKLSTLNYNQDLWGYFSSNRQQGKGYDNIYSFLLPSIKISITGYVVDTDGEPIPEAIVRVVGRNGMNYKSLTKPDGSYFAAIDRSTQYVMMAGKQGYLNRKAEFTSDPAEEDADYEVDFVLPSISVPVLIDNIFYDYNSATLREESYPSLDDLVQLLNDNPYCAIELSAHTDRVGSQNFNLDLSQRRAESVVEYLVSQGIDEERLTPVGYGKAEPKQVDDNLHAKYDFLPEGQLLDEEFVNSLDPEQREIADQINRRTEFQVLTTTFGIE